MDDAVRSREALIGEHGAAGAEISRLKVAVVEMREAVELQSQTLSAARATHLALQAQVTSAEVDVAATREKVGASTCRLLSPSPNITICFAFQLLFSLPTASPTSPSLHTVFAKR